MQTVEALPKRFDDILQKGYITPPRHYKYGEPVAIHFAVCEVTRDEDGEYALVEVTGADFGRGFTDQYDKVGNLLKIRRT